MKNILRSIVNSLKDNVKYNIMFLYLNKFLKFIIPPTQANLQVLQHLAKIFKIEILRTYSLVDLVDVASAVT